ncbi:MAG: hypothetical protein HY744_07470 [Deltaproteobacteria bacterium]|nr:hypothetical protein [Deltaproteobacteria bacterium]
MTKRAQMNGLWRRALLPALLLVVAGACEFPKPPVPVPTKPRERLLVQKQFRLGAFDFGRNVDQKFDPLAEALPAMLLTEIRKEGRFSVYEGGNIRAHRPKGEALNEANAAEHVDGYLSGTITKQSDSEICFDVRLANAVNHEVLYAATACAPLAPATAAVPGQPRGEPAMAPDREAMGRVAKDLSRAIKQVGFGQVTSVDGKLVFVDKGAEADVMPGMVAYLVATGDSVRDPAVHANVKDFTGVDPTALTMATTPVTVGEMYVVSVEKAYSVGLLYRGDFALPGDTVFFK